MFDPVMIGVAGLVVIPAIAHYFWNRNRREDERWNKKFQAHDAELEALSSQAEALASNFRPLTATLENRAYH